MHKFPHTEVTAVWKAESREHLVDSVYNFFVMIKHNTHST